MKKKASGINKSSGHGVAIPEQTAFEEIVGLIEQSRLRAAQAVNTTLIELYWSVGKYISRKIQLAGWGKGTVQALSAYVQRKQPGIRRRDYFRPPAVGETDPQSNCIISQSFFLYIIHCVSQIF